MRAHDRFSSLSLLRCTYSERQRHSALFIYSNVVNDKGNVSLGVNNWTFIQSKRFYGDNCLHFQVLRLNTIDYTWTIFLISDLTISLRSVAMDSDCCVLLLWLRGCCCCVLLLWLLGCCCVLLLWLLGCCCVLLLWLF